jgi:hypothetical protein
MQKRLLILGTPLTSSVVGSALLSNAQPRDNNVYSVSLHYTKTLVFDQIPVRSNAQANRKIEEPKKEAPEGASSSTR